MSNERDKHEVSRGADADAAPSEGEAAAALPRPLQEHLAQKLRSAYQELAPKPAFLGDPAVPAEFEYHLQRLEAVEKVRHQEKVHNQAIEAVKAALETIAGAPLDTEPSKAGQEPGRADEK